MLLEMYREPSKGGATLSRLHHGDTFICDVLEDEVREKTGQLPPRWKIKGVTAIPFGKYKITLETSARFGPNTLTVNNVPGFEGIRIHGGNTQFNTEGCLLPGTRNSENTVADSQTALKKLKAVIWSALSKGEVVEINIKRKV